MSTDDNTSVLQVSNLTKVYGWEFQLSSRKLGRRVEAVTDVSFSVKKGEIFGFLGPNGAGKTTTIRSILGFLSIKSGSIKINGLDYLKDALEIKKSLGFIRSEIELYGNFTGNEIISYFGKFRPIDQKFLKKLKKIFKVDLTLDFKSMSTGNRQQVIIIAALASNPDFVILDEPSSGLDPLMAARFHRLLVQMRDEGKTIFLSSHNLTEVQEICDRVGIIRKGRIIVIESVKELQRKSMQQLTVEFFDGEAPDVADFQALPNVFSVEKKADTYYIKVSEDVNDLLKFITARRIKRMTLEDSSLEDIFLTYYKDELDLIEEGVKEE
ncbi:MAG: ATP-binding cassette domain-containing protein [Candidatus Hodarchaeales archaeon]|jgi:ABC-2 type transport system ATP-binding protein